MEMHYNKYIFIIYIFIYLDYFFILNLDTKGTLYHLGFLYLIQFNNHFEYIKYSSLSKL